MNKKIILIISSILFVIVTNGQEKQYIRNSKFEENRNLSKLENDFVRDISSDKSFESKTKISLLDSTLDFVFFSNSDSNLFSRTIYNYDSNGNQSLIEVYENSTFDPRHTFVSPRYRYETSYDENGNEILRLIYERSSDSNKWVIARKEESKFNNRNNLMLIETFNWNADLKMWDIDFKEELDYNANGNIISHIAYSWYQKLERLKIVSSIEYIYDESQNLITKTKTFPEYLKIESNYDQNGNEIINTRYLWSNRTNDWRGEKKTQFTFDDNQDLIEKTNYKLDFESNKWVFNERHEYAYLGNDTISHEIYLWRKDLKIWREHRKYESDYDENGNITSFIINRWHASLNNWYEFQKYEYGYDENNNKILEIFHWNKEAAHKTEWTYNENQKLILEVEYSRKSDTMDWVSSYKNEYKHDTLGNLVLTINSVWTDSINDWSISSKIYSYYSQTNLIEEIDENTTNSIEKISFQNFTVFPNPAEDILLVKSNENFKKVTMDLFDLKGQKVLSKDLSSSHTLSIKHLKSGIYLYNITSDGKLEQGKLIKK